MCYACASGDEKGNCRLPAGETCALESFLPDLVTIVSTNPARPHEVYLELLRNTICVQCNHQLSNGTCKKRQMLECALDRYYPTVIEIVKNVKGEVERSGNVAPRKV